MITCVNCHATFEPERYSLVAEAASAGALSGALLGARVGIVAGPWGALSGAVVGGVVAGMGGARVIQCPCCDEIIWL